MDLRGERGAQFGRIADWLFALLDLKHPVLGLANDEINELGDAAGAIAMSEDHAAECIDRNCHVEAARDLRARPGLEPVEFADLWLGRDGVARGAGLRVDIDESLGEQAEQIGREHRLLLLGQISGWALDERAGSGASALEEFVEPDRAQRMVGEDTQDRMVKVSPVEICWPAAVENTTVTPGAKSTLRGFVLNAAWNASDFTASGASLRRIRTALGQSSV